MEKVTVWRKEDFLRQLKRDELFLELTLKEQAIDSSLASTRASLQKQSERLNK